MGPPESGKSNLLRNLINKDEYYGNKFDQIIYITPTSLEGIDHGEDNTLKSLDAR